MRPTEHGFVGPLAGELEEYIRFKASMGRHGATRVQVLRSFDRHCLEHGAVRLERGVVERWIAHRIDANPGGCRSWFSYIRDFGRWMRLAHDPDAYVLSDQWKAGSPRPTPYLLTDREAALFLRAAGTLESPSPWSIPRPVAAAGCPWATRSPPNCWNATNGPANASETTVPRSSSLPPAIRTPRACPAWCSAASGRGPGSSGHKPANGPGPMISGTGSRSRTSSGGLATVWT